MTDLLLLIGGAILWAGAGYLTVTWAVAHVVPPPCSASLISGYLLLISGYLLLISGYLLWPLLLLTGVCALLMEDRSLIPPPPPTEGLDEVQVMERLAKGRPWWQRPQKPD